MQGELRKAGDQVALVHYPHAPLTEAVIDIRAKLPEGTVHKTILEAALDKKAGYPTSDTLFVYSGSFSAGSQVTAASTQRLNGFRFISQDEKQVFQARLDVYL